MLDIPAGLVTPLGIGTTRVWENLLQGKCGITQIYDESMNYSFTILFFAQKLFER